MKIAAVMFDFDGVLVDTEWAIYQAWSRTYQDYGQRLELADYTRCIGSDFATWSPKNQLEELTSLEFDWTALDAIRQQEIMRDLEPEGAMSGAEKCLAVLQAARIPCAVVSSSSHAWVDTWLEKIKLRDYFSAVVCRGDAPRIKPAPDLFFEAARCLGVAPQNTLVLEDSLNGLRAAKAAGMKTWIVPNRITTGLDFSTADGVFPNLGEVASRLTKSIVISC